MTRIIFVRITVVHYVVCVSIRVLVSSFHFRVSNVIQCGRLAGVAGSDGEGSCGTGGDGGDGKDDGSGEGFFSELGGEGSGFELKLEELGDGKF